jgi:flagellar M-ring protein FliF
LSPYLGVEQFAVSATVRLNADKRQTNETIFDPDKRVERSTRVVKETQSSQDGAGGGVVSAEQNIPDESGSPKGNDQNKRAQDRKEETANYEIGSKSTTVTSDGYRIEGLSVAIVVNKRRLVESLGKELSDDELKEEVSRIEQLAQSAIGFDPNRGDRLSVAAVNFVPGAAMSEDEGAPAWTFMLLSLAGVLIKSMTVLAVVAIVVWVGFKPAIRTLLNGVAGNEAVPALAGPGASLSSEIPILQNTEMASPLSEPGVNPFGTDVPSEFGSVYGRRQIDVPQERLGKIIEMDEAKATEVLRDWVRNG